jgi:hypothetical protein
MEAQQAAAARNMLSVSYFINLMQWGKGKGNIIP